jgi:hypothetical protein
MAKKAPAKPPAKRKPRAKKPPASVTVIDPIVKPSSPWRRVMLVGACVAGLVAYTAGVVWFCGGIQVGPKPVDPVPVVPEPVTSFRVIFVKESGQTLQGQQSAIPAAKEIRDYLQAKTTQEGGLPGWREYDPQQSTTNEQPVMRALWDAVKPKLLPAPCLVVEVNGKATVMPFPNTVADAVATLKKAGGQ